MDRLASFVCHKLARRRCFYEVDFFARSTRTAGVPRMGHTRGVQLILRC